MFVHLLIDLFSQLLPENCTHLFVLQPSFKSVFLKLFYSIAPFSPSARGFRPPNLIKQTQGSKFKEFYLKQV